MKFLKLFKWYELVYFGIVCTLLFALGLIFHSEWYIIVNSFLGIFAVFLICKAIVWGYFVGILQLIFYIYIAVKNAYYGEVISCLINYLPFYIAAIYTWFKNKDDGQVKINNNYSFKELLVAIIVFFVISFGVYFMLKAFNTANLIISTISFCLASFSGYLQVRRSELNFIINLINDIMILLLWLSLVLQGSLSYIPTVSTYVIYFTLDVFGLIVWLKLKKKQKNKENGENKLKFEEKQQI